MIIAAMANNTQPNMFQPDICPRKGKDPVTAKNKTNPQSMKNAKSLAARAKRPGPGSFTGTLGGITSPLVLKASISSKMTGHRYYKRPT